MVATTADFQILTAIVCDDVRTEITNKDMLIGAYAGNANVNVLPYHAKVCLWTIARWVGAGKISIGFRALGTAGEIIPLRSINAEAIAPGKPSSMWVKDIEFTVTAPGTLQFQFKKPQGNWETVCELLITHQGK